MKKSSVRAVFIGVGLFLGLLITWIFSEPPVTVETFIPPAVGGLVAGLVVYFFDKCFTRKSKL